jgi:putative FmdB family regulatory protein
MPLYEYDCRRHGVFESMHSISEATAPEPCPSCGEDAPRILSAPRLACVEPSERKARDRNEKSRHEPRLVRKPASPLGSERPALRSSHASRPWCLEHG